MAIQNHFCDRTGSGGLLKYMQMIADHPRAALACVTLVTILLGAFIPHLKIQTTIYDLVIEDLPENKDYKEFKKLFGSEEIIRLVMKCDNVFAPENFRVLEAVDSAARKIEGVRRVISLPAVKRAVDLSGSWPIVKFRNLVKPLALLKRNLVSEDDRTTLLTLVLSQDAEYESVIAAVNQLIKERPEPFSSYQIGMPLISKALADFTERDFKKLPAITLLLIAVVLFLLFRHPLGVVMPLSCVLLALIWTFGLIAAAGIPLSMLTMIVPVFLIAVGTAYCLHIITEYRKQSQSADSAGSAVVATYLSLTFPTILAILTTMFGLGSLFVNRIEAIREFAWFACLGMACFFILLHTYLPAALASLPRISGKTGSVFYLKGIQWLINTVIRLNLEHSKVTLAIFSAISIFCIIGLFQMKVESNPVGYFKADTDVRRHFHDIYQDLSGSFPLNVVVDGQEADFFERPESIAMLARAQVFLNQVDGVDKTISFADYLMLVNYAANRFRPEYYKLPEEGFEVRMLLNTFKTMLGEDLLYSFTNRDFSKANILLLTHISSSSRFLAVRELIQNEFQRKFSKSLKWDVTGFGIVVSASNYHLTTGQVESLSISLVLIFGIMFVLFLSCKVGLIAIVPNLFPILVAFGAMGWLGIELSMATSLIASIAIGLAIDDTIHYLVRYNREFRSDLNERRSLEDTIRHIGQPIIFTTVTIGIGFSVLIFSGFRPTAVFGVLMVVTMISALVADLMLLPTLMLKVELITIWDLVRIKMGGEGRIDIPLFKGLSRTELHYVMMAGAIRQMQAGEVLFRKGEQSDTMYTVISGSFDVIDYDIHTDASVVHNIQKRINRLRKGDIIGEMGLLRGAPRSASIVTAEAGELLQINWKVIKRMQWLYPPIAHKFFRNLLEILCQRLDRTTQCYSEDSKVDDLTGLSNQKAFCRMLDMERHRAERYGNASSMALLSFGNSALGNRSTTDNGRLLTLTSQCLYNNMRRTDALARVDTYTFALLFTETAPDTAANIATRIKAGLGNGPLKKFAADEINLKLHALPDPSHPSCSEWLQSLLANH